jgi:hypothetical protein|nr:MAG TPA: hypothetical protein [Caudoviricetes sp.]
MDLSFIRFSSTIKVKSQNRVVSVTVRPVISNCTGDIYYTDIQLQEGRILTSYTPHVSAMINAYSKSPNYHNGIVRSNATVIVFNLGTTSSGLDCYIYPKQDMADGTIGVAQGAGSHRAYFVSAASADDEFALLATKRECLKNGVTTEKVGFYQYTAACDSKHHLKLEPHKSARILFKYYEILEKERNR